MSVRHWCLLDGKNATKTVLAAFRTLMKNQGLAASPMVALMRSALEPADGSWEMTPGKQWLIREDSGLEAHKKLYKQLLFHRYRQNLMN